MVVAQGWEAGGHVWGGVATLPLVPAVVDQQVQQAEAALTNAKLIPQLTYRVRQKPLGTVTFQNPKASRQPLGTIVQLTVSLGPQPKPVVTTPTPTTPPAVTTTPVGPTTGPPAGTTSTPPPAVTTTPVTPTTTAAPPVSPAA